MAPGRILLDVTDLMALLAEREHPSGIPRVVSCCLDELDRLGTGVVPIFHSQITRAYCRIDGRRLLDRDLSYFRWLEPARGRHLRRALAYLGPLRRGRVEFAPQDTLLILGGGWGFPKRTAFLSGRAARDCRVVWFCHDLIPVLHPEFMMDSPDFAKSFQNWLDSAIANGHHFICSTRFVEADLQRYATGIGATVDISVVPLAHEFKPVAGHVRPEIAALPPRGFVLCAGAIATRKNHIALLRAWQRLHGERGGSIPLLVLAGDLIEDAPIKAFLRDTGDVGGKVILLGPVTEAELSALYRDCLFTVFPSLNEGWGLPVGESLWMGKPCLSSNQTSLPEVGGRHAVYFDPSNEDELLAALRDAIGGTFSAMPPRREELRSWRQVAQDLLATLRAMPPR